MTIHRLSSSNISEQVTFQHQADALLNQAAPVANTWYTVLNTTPNCRIIGISALILVANETLECRITADGVIVPAMGVAATFATDYFALLVCYPVGLYIGLTTTPQYPERRSFLIGGRSVKVEVRKTTAAGAGNLQACVAYAKIP